MRDTILSAIENFETGGYIFDRSSEDPFTIIDDNTFSFIADGDMDKEVLGKTVEVRVIVKECSSPCLRCKGRGYTEPVKHVSGISLKKHCTMCRPEMDGSYLD